MSSTPEPVGEFPEFSEQFYRDYADRQAEMRNRFLEACRHDADLSVRLRRWLPEDAIHDCVGEELADDESS